MSKDKVINSLQRDGYAWFVHTDPNDPEKLDHPHVHEEGYNGPWRRRGDLYKRVSATKREAVEALKSDGWAPEALANKWVLIQVEIVDSYILKKEVRRGSKITMALPTVRRASGKRKPYKPRANKLINIDSQKVTSGADQGALELTGI